LRVDEVEVLQKFAEGVREAGESILDPAEFSRILREWRSMGMEEAMGLVPGAERHCDEEVGEEVGEERVDEEGVDEEGADEEGVNEEGVEEKGVNEEGVNEEGVDEKGVIEEGLAEEGVEEKGVDAEGVNEEEDDDKLQISVQNRRTPPGDSIERENIPSSPLEQHLSAQDRPSDATETELLRRTVSSPVNNDPDLAAAVDETNDDLGAGPNPSISDVVPSLPDQGKIDAEKDESPEPAGKITKVVLTIDGRRPAQHHQPSVSPENSQSDSRNSRRKSTTPSCGDDSSDSSSSPPKVPRALVLPPLDDQLIPRLPLVIAMNDNGEIVWERKGINEEGKETSWRAIAALREGEEGSC